MSWYASTGRLSGRTATATAWRGLSWAGSIVWGATGRVTRGRAQAGSSHETIWTSPVLLSIRATTGRSSAPTATDRVCGPGAKPSEGTRATFRVTGREQPESVQEIKEITSSYPA
ncbi:hypothetical protein ACWEPL_04300 [Nonomuraea sp. NPDC004186]